jgi:hypothetical protein
VRYLGQETVESRPELKTWNAGSPARVDLDKVTTYKGEYRPLSQFRLGSIYPVVEGYKDSVTAGVRLNYADPLALHSLDMTLAATAGEASSDERFHFKAAYEHAPWKVTLRYNATDFPTSTTSSGRRRRAARGTRPGSRTTSSSSTRSRARSSTRSPARTTADSTRCPTTRT